MVFLWFLSFFFFFFFKAWLAGRGWSDFDSGCTQPTLCVIYQGAFRLSCSRRCCSQASASLLLSLQNGLLCLVMSCAGNDEARYLSVRVCLCVRPASVWLLHPPSCTIPCLCSKHLFCRVASPLMHSIDYFVRLICMWRAGVQRCALLHVDKGWHFAEDQRYWSRVCFFGRALMTTSGPSWWMLHVRLCKQMKTMYSSPAFSFLTVKWFKVMLTFYKQHLWENRIYVPWTRLYANTLAAVFLPLNKSYVTLPI